MAQGNCPGGIFNQQVPPTSQERQGNFSDVCPASSASAVDTTNFPDCPVNLSTGSYYPNHTVPVDPNAQYLLALMPEANHPNNYYNAAPALPTHWREELFPDRPEFQRQIRPSSFRFIHDSWSTLRPTPLGTMQGSFPTIQTDFVGPASAWCRATVDISPTLLNEFVPSYTTDHIFLVTWSPSRACGMPMGDLFPGNGDGILPGINLSGGNAYGGGFGEDAGYIPNGPYNSNPTYSYRDNVSKIIGKHNLQFGGYFVAAQKNELGGELAAG